MKDIAIMIAKKAGDYLLNNFRKDESLLKKRGMSKEIITEYDKESDRIIIEELRKNFPEHNYLTEESGEFDNGSDKTWIIDSMDGSGNFASGNPFFSVSIALVKNDEPIIGVIYAPFLGELYVAEKGQGATLNGESIGVSDVSELSQIYTVTCEGGSKSNARLANIYAQIYPKMKDMRKIGSAAIEGGYVASGRADAYLTLNISPWDVAATVLIAKEAGGKATDFSGNKWTPDNCDLLITNGVMHDEMLALLKEL